MRSALAPLALSSCLLAASACADASGRFEEFEQRRFARDAEGGAPTMGIAGAPGCAPPAPGEVQGPALLALETATSPGVAILFFGELETPDLEGKTAVKYSYRALDASDRRAEVGPPLLVGPYAIEDDGKFDAPTAESTLPGSANAILPGIPITSELTLHGTICGVEAFYCGTVTGTITAPVAGPTTGQFGLTLLADVSEVPMRPRYGCDEAALAPPLPD